jgi:hypothetical protein
MTASPFECCFISVILSCRPGLPGPQLPSLGNSDMCTTGAICKRWDRNSLISNRALHLQQNAEFSAMAFSPRMIPSLTAPIRPDRFDSLEANGP